MVATWPQIKAMALSCPDAVERLGPNGFEQVDCVQLAGFRPQVVSFCEADGGGCNCVIGGEFIVGVESVKHAVELLTALRVEREAVPAVTPGRN